jgi:uncharacterized protein (DUF4415 family)
MSDDTMTKFSVAKLAQANPEESRTDMGRLRRMTEAQLADRIADDPDWKDVGEDWHLQAEAVMPVQKKLFSMRVDADVLAWFRSQGAGYQTRMNAVLRSFMEYEMRRRAG